MDETGSATGYQSDLANVPEGTRVVGADGAKLGEVVGVYRDRLIVERGFFFPTDFYVPFDAVDVYEAGTIRLGLSLNGALRQGWDAVPADESVPVLPSAPAPAVTRPAPGPAPAEPPVAQASRGRIVQPEVNAPLAPRPAETDPAPAAPPAASEPAPPATPPTPDAVLPPSDVAAAPAPPPTASVPSLGRPGARTSTLGRLFPDLVAGAEPEQSTTAPPPATPAPVAESAPANATADSPEPSEAPAAAGAEPAASGAAPEPAEPSAVEDPGEVASTTGEAPAATETDGSDRSDETGGTARPPTA